MLSGLGVFHQAMTASEQPLLDQAAEDGPLAEGEAAPAATSALQESHLHRIIKILR